MTTPSPCVSTASPCSPSPCDYPIAERPRYFPRQIITPDDLTLEQEYFRNKMRRHNRLMHGWGVVCGARVCLTPQTAGSSTSTSNFQPWMVTVTSGYILGPYGDEIVLDCCRAIDLRTSGTSGVTGDPCVQASDPWCTDVYVQRQPNVALYVAVKYSECKTRPVRVQPAGCGCSDNSCEYSRLHDGYEIGILTSCPDGATKVLDPTSLNTTPDCPTCPAQPWVVLASVTVDSNGNVQTIDNCTCRRIVVSYGSTFKTCPTVSFQLTNIQPPVKSTVPDLQQIPVGTTGVAATVSTANLTTGTEVTASLGPGVSNVQIQPTKTDPSTFNLTFDVDATAATGSRNLVVSTANSLAVIQNAINIVPAPAPTTTTLTPAAKKPTSGGSSTPADTGKSTTPPKG